MDKKYDIIKKEDGSTTVVEVDTNKNEVQEATNKTMTDISTQAQVQLVNDVKTGKMSLSEAATEAAKTGATVEAAKENSKKLTKLKGQELSNSFESDKAKSRADKIKSTNEGNEAFYESYRPILEFDFSHITGTLPQRSKSKKADPDIATEKEVVSDAKSRAYSKPIMIMTIILAVIPWLCIAMVLYVLKGVNAIVELVKQFTKIAQGLIISGAVIIVIYVILVIIDSLMKAYIGHGILP